MSYIADANAKMIAQLTALRPATITGDADDFRCQQEHIKAVAAVMDDYFHSVAVDGAQDSHEINPQNFIGLVSNAVHDTSLHGSFGDAAEAIEAETSVRSDYAEHNTMHRAFQGV